MCDFLCDLRDGFGATLGLGDLAAKVVRREVSVPLGHRQRGVAEDLLKGLEAAAPHDEPRGEVVAAVVEVEGVDLPQPGRKLARLGHRQNDARGAEQVAQNFCERGDNRQPDRDPVRAELARFFAGSDDVVGYGYYGYYGQSTERKKTILGSHC